METLADRVAVVTGAGSGIGAGMARAFAREGMRLALADIESDPVHGLADELRADGCEVLAEQVDVAKSSQVEAFAARVFDELGGAHLLCNNAGVCQGGPIAEMSENDWRWILSVNLEGVINGCRAFVPRLVAQGEPVVAYTEALSQELLPHGIGVSVLCPGFVNTDLGNSGRRRPAELGQAPAKMESILPGMAEGMDPVEVGRRVVRGVRENALYVFTHPEFKPIVEQRFAQVLAAMDRAARPLD
jgi:NAD(P)-dependent dehydrogenase (short-subunit alcohol dehydrogenase family)